MVFNPKRGRIILGGHDMTPTINQIIAEFYRLEKDGISPVLLTATFAVRDTIRNESAASGPMTGDSRL